MQKEIEARFLGIDEAQVIEKLNELGATDKGSDLLSETIFYDKDNTWTDRYVRLRTRLGVTALTYKHIPVDAVDGAQEIEFTVPDANAAEELLTAIGLVASRRQEKRRHTFLLDDVTVDIDTWPRIPTYLELEGPSEEALRETAAKIGFQWEDAVFVDARKIIEQTYGVPVGSMTWFTFGRFE